VAPGALELSLDQRLNPPPPKRPPHPPPPPKLSEKSLDRESPALRDADS
jgi:hypothetical protein